MTGTQRNQLSDIAAHQNVSVNERALLYDDVDDVDIYHLNVFDESTHLLGAGYVVVAIPDLLHNKGYWYSTYVGLLHE